MTSRRTGTAWVTAVLCTAVLLPTAARANHAGDCPEPGTTWRTATPAQQHLDKGELDFALHAYQDRRGFAVRIYRRGCLVSKDTVLGSETAQHDGWEMTTSVLGLLALRQFQLGLLAPEDPVGALIGEADRVHGAITVRDLLERTTGLSSAPDNAFAEHDLLRALARPAAATARGRFGDSPAANTLLAEVLQRAARDDLQRFAARELFTPLGLRSFNWVRDQSGTTRATFGLQLTADDMARLAELVRRGGVWRGRRLLPADGVAAMLTPQADPCHGWLTWLNARPGCAGTTRRLLPGLPADLWSWRGRYDQRVVVLPALELVVVRYGTSGGDQRSTTDQATWERGVLQRLVAAVRDTAPVLTQGASLVPPSTEFPWADDATARTAPPPALRPPGPSRTRAPRVTIVREEAGRARLVGVRIACPALAARTCTGTAQLRGIAARTKSWTVPAGAQRTVLLRLRRRPQAPVSAIAVVTAADDGDGVRVEAPLTVRR